MRNQVHLDQQPLPQSRAAGTRPRRARCPRLLAAAALAAIACGAAFGSAAVLAMHPEQPSSTSSGPPPMSAAGDPLPLRPGGDPLSIPPPSWREAAVSGRLLQAKVAGVGLNQVDPFPLIDACVTEEMTATNTPGASLAIMVDGELVYAKGYGVKHEGEEGAVDADTLFRIGSTTKMMTAAAVMQQVEAGRVDLSQPLATYIPDWDINGAWDAPEVTGADVTPWHLLTHTSAYPDRIFIDTGIDGPKVPTALEDWARTGVSVTLHAPPGSFWNYSNPGFSLAGLVVQNVTETPYADYMRDAVWGPAGMDATFLLPEDAVAYGNYTHGHRWLDQTTGQEIVYAPDDYDNWVAAPAGYAFSRPKDLVRWADLLMQGGADVLSQESVDEMQAAQASQDIIPGLDYGYGIFRTVDAELNRVIYDHGGNIPGWSSQLIWSPDDRVAVSVLANTITSLRGAAGCALLTMLDVDPIDGPDYDTDPATWDPYLGEYFGLQVDGAELRLEVTRGATDTLVASFPDIPIAPGVVYTSTLRQAALDTFLIDLTGDTIPDDAITFLEHPDRPGDTYWFRARRFVLTKLEAVPPGWSVYLPKVSAGGP